jgi:hypothetical protein
MRRFLLDTGIANDYIHRRLGVYTRAKAREALGDVLGICTPVLGELWDGVESSASRKRNEARLRHELPAFKIWPYTEATPRSLGVFALCSSVSAVLWGR